MLPPPPPTYKGDTLFDSHSVHSVLIYMSTDLRRYQFICSSNGSLVFDPDIRSVYYMDSHTMRHLSLARAGTSTSPHEGLSQPRIWCVPKCPYTPTVPPPPWHSASPIISHAPEVQPHAPTVQTHAPTVHHHVLPHPPDDGLLPRRVHVPPRGGPRCTSEPKQPWCLTVYLCALFPRFDELSALPCLPTWHAYGDSGGCSGRISGHILSSWPS